MNSYRQILRSSAIIGGASVINILIGLLRIKVAAMLLGPSGIGTIGLLQSLMSTAATVSALGFGNVGTRQIAEAASKGDIAEIATARRALFWGTMGLALGGSLVFWLLRNVLATQILSDPRYGNKIGWLAIGVALSVAAGSQTALLNGLHHVGDLARISVLSALVSTLLGVGALLWMQQDGILLFVLAIPISAFVLGHWFATRIDRIQTPNTHLFQLIQQWNSMIRLGVAFMVSGLVVTLGQLLIRILIQQKLGIEALGVFQAAWAISMTYIGFVLTAMSTDYYPRLTATIHDHATTNRLVNEQTEVVLLLSGPVFIAMLGLAPWIISLLYSDDFVDAALILRWQVLGDILKVTSWPLGFIIMAAGDGRTFFLCELTGISVFVLCTWIGMPMFGIQATGVGFFIMYTLHLPLVYWLARYRTGFVWERRVLIQFSLLLSIACGVVMLVHLSKIASALLGLLCGLGLMLFGVARLGKITNISGLMGKFANISRHLMLIVRIPV